MTSPTAPAVERTIPPALVTRLGNPLLGWLLSGPRRAARLGDTLLLLHVTGRRTGATYSTPVAYHRQPDSSLVVLTSSGWRVNLRGGDVPVQLTLHGRRVPATAALEEDPDAVAEVYEHLLDEVGLARAGQRLGIRVNVDRAPTHDELVDAARRDHLSMLRLRTGDPR